MPLAIPIIFQSKVIISLAIYKVEVFDSVIHITGYPFSLVSII